MQTAEQETRTTAAVHNGFVHAAPLDVQKRIGSTVYDIKVYSKNDNTAETIEDKLLRLAKNDLNTVAGNATMMIPQTGRLPERGSA